MNAQATKLLASASAQDRLKGVRLLAQTADAADALPVLARLVKNDPDAAVRDLALQTGRHLRAEQRTTLNAAVAQAAPPIVTAPPPAAPEPALAYRGAADKSVKPEVQRRARVLTDNALNLSSSGDDAKALKMLAQALDLNPALARDAYFASVAVQVTGRDDFQDAVAAISNQGRRKALEAASSAAQQRKARADHLTKTQTVTWGSVVLDFLVFAGILLVGWTLGLVALHQFALARLLPVIDTVAREQTFTTLSGALTALLVLTPQSLLIGLALATAIYAMVTLVVHAVVFHLLMMLLRATGTLPYLMSQMLVVQNRFLGIMLVVAVLGFGLTLQLVGDWFIFLTVLVLAILQAGLNVNVVQRLSSAYKSSRLVLLLAFFITGLAVQAVGIGVSFATTPLLTVNPTEIEARAEQLMRDIEVYAEQRQPPQPR